MRDLGRGDWVTAAPGHMLCAHPSWGKVLSQRLIAFRWYVLSTAWLELYNFEQLKIYCWNRLQWAPAGFRKSWDRVWVQSSSVAAVPLCSGSHNQREWDLSVLLVSFGTQLHCDSQEDKPICCLLHSAILTMMDLQWASKTLFCYHYSLGPHSICFDL